MSIVDYTSNNTFSTHLRKTLLAQSASARSAASSLNISTSELVAGPRSVERIRAHALVAVEGTMITPYFEVH